MAAQPPAVVLGYGMGADSTAILLRWIFEPATRPCDLADLLVVTAQTGDEWPVTGQLVAAHILPLLARHGIRYAQIARSGPRQADGVTVLADTRQPATVHLGGDYRLSSEMTRAGTVPQAGGARKCSAKAKGWPLDRFIAAQTHGQPFTHVIGFEANEASRALRDATFNTETRTGAYPLIEWGWDRAACETYIEQVLGVAWSKSACVYCPFALLNHAGRARVTAAFEADPAAGVAGLMMEHLAVSLNPRQGLMAGQRLAALLAATPGQEATTAAFEAALDRAPWALYEVRRALLPRAGSKAANARRWLAVHATGTRQEMTAALGQAAREHGQPADTGDGIGRVWLARRAGQLPATERFYVAAPAGADPKIGPGFEAAWAAATAGPAQLDLFATA